MAVVVQCYHCSNILELDDGFRGGVCRCSQCGALLQVPKGVSSEMRKARPAAPGATPTDVKRPESPLADPGLSRGQFDPRSPRVGTTEGGISSGAFARSPVRPAGPAAATRRAATTRPVAGQPAHVRRRSNTLLYVSLGFVLVVTLVAGIVIVVVAMRSVKEPDQHGSPAPTTPAIVPLPAGPVVTPAPGVTTPNFFTVPLVGHKIVFSIDTGTSGQDSFDYVRKGLERAIGMLGRDQEFKIAWWHENGLLVVPETGWQGRQGLDKITRDIEGTGTLGATDAEAAMRASLQLDGDQVIMVTCKPLLPASLAPAVLAVRGQQRIDTVTTLTEEGSPLEKIATDGNGKYVRATQSMLQSFAAGK